MSTARRLVLLRHGRTAWNAEGRAQGWADVELDATGHEQAAGAAPYVAALGPVALWSSDLARARQTCAYLEKETGLVATHDARLREFSVGVRQGLTHAEFAERYPVEFEQWRLTDVPVAAVGGESVAEVRERVLPALEELLVTLQPGETGVVVMHGAALKVGLLALLGWPDEHYLSLRPMDNCRWSTVEQAPDGRRRMVGYNEGVPDSGDVPPAL